MLGGRGEFSCGGQHFSDDGVDVRLSGAVVDDAGAESEVATECGVGEINAAPADDAIEDAAVEVVEIR